jgi:hypothetical protein
MVVGFDARALPAAPGFKGAPCPARFTLQAHDGAVSALDVNPHVRGCLATGGTDKLVKVWALDSGADDAVKNVSLVTSRDLGVVRVLFPLMRRAGLTMCAGQGLHDRVVARRPAHARRRGLEGAPPDLGRRRERGRAQGVRAAARRRGPRAPRPRGRRRHRCPGRRRGQRGRRRRRRRVAHAPRCTMWLPCYSACLLACLLAGGIAAAMTLPRAGVVSWGPHGGKVLNPGLLAKHTKM